MAIIYDEGLGDDDLHVYLIMNNGFAWREFWDDKTGEMVREEMCDEEEEEELYAELAAK
jgi:hypothetical protein